MGSSLHPRDVLQAEEAIRALEAAYDDAWNRGDIDALLDCFTNDALIVDPRGGVTQGHDGIRHFLSHMVSPDNGDSTHKSEIVRVEFLTPKVAVVDGRAQIKGLPEEQNAKGFVHRFTDVVAWREGRWKIAHIRACPLEADTPRGN
jgi:uncharacterized protein (TIGR02246 family)